MFSADLLDARDPAVASRFAATLCLVSGGLSAGMTILVPQDIEPGMKTPVVAASMAMMLVGVLVLCIKGPARRWLLIATPFLGIATIVLATIGTNDASAGGQVFLCAPLLFAASQMRKEVAWLTCACAILGEAAITLSVLPLDRATSDLVFVSTAGVMITWLLVQASERNDALMGELRAQAAIDPLTGLVTRRVLDRTADSVLSSEHGEDGTALIVLDVDWFKTINDTWGHPVGDAVLVHIADLLRAMCRPDTVLSRLGGDELAVLLPGCPYGVAVQRAQAIVDTVRESPLHLPDGDVVPLSISVGVAHAPMRAAALRELYAAADESLYDAKNNGRGRVGARVLVREGDTASV